MPDSAQTARVRLSAIQEVIEWFKAGGYDNWAKALRREFIESVPRDEWDRIFARVCLCPDDGTGQPTMTSEQCPMHGGAALDQEAS